MGHPAQDGDPGPRDPEVRRPDALDRGLPRGDDRGPEGPRRRGRLDAVLHHDAAQPALRRVRPLQFHHLKDGDFVKIDKHPVIWCPKDQAPIGDHDRIEGEGEVPMEYTLLKFPLADGRFLVAATIRPETVYGQTNLWVDPKAPYVAAMVGEERWILNELAAKKLSEQGRTVVVESTLRGVD